MINSTCPEQSDLWKVSSDVSGFSKANLQTQLTSLYPDQLLLVGIDQAVTTLQAK